MMKSQKQNLGATMVESAIVIAVLLVAVLGIMEVSRYYMTKATLQRAVKQGLELAIRHDALLINYNSADTAQKALLVEAYNQIKARASTKDVTKSTSKLANVVDQAIPGVDAGPILVLRPGESGSYQSINGTTEIEVDHPTHSAADSRPNEVMADLLRTHPIMVEMNAAMPSILPFLGDMPIRVQALGMAEIPPVGIDGAPGDENFVAPQCGDGIFQGSFEQCEHVGQLGLNSVAHYCRGDCRERHRCGNGQLDVVRNASNQIVYEEQCDKANAYSTGAIAFEKECTDNCQLVDIPPCGNQRIEEPEECDDGIQGPENGLLEGQVCVNCRKVRLPECASGVYIQRPCGPNDLDRFVCYDCAGEDLGRCPDGDIALLGPDSPCLPGSGTVLEETEWCNPCKGVQDRCNNGFLGDSNGGYIEECEGDLLADGRLITDVYPTRFCSDTCQLVETCNNGRLDPGEECDGTIDGGFNPSGKTYGNGRACDRYCTCSNNCTIVRPDCLDVEQCPDNYRIAIIPNTDPVQCQCCPTQEGAIGCVPTLTSPTPSPSP